MCLFREECNCKLFLCVFAQDEARPEDEMAQRRAALLEKQQKRAEEVKRRKQWQELDSK